MVVIRVPRQGKDLDIESPKYPPLHVLILE